MKAGETKPEWLKIRLPRGEAFAQTARLVREHGLHTICSSGLCPNRAECWSRRTATMMILGDVCTRGCRFCATSTGKPLVPDPAEAQRVAETVRLMGLKHAVITSVTRDDLEDGGAAHWRRVVEEVRAQNPETTIELLIPDFGAAELGVIFDARPDIVGHNIETVERLTPLVRDPRAGYRKSLETLKGISERGMRTKSGIMVGMGETFEEVLRTLDDLRAAGVDIVTLGQYLQPTAEHLPVAEWVAPVQFERYKEEALRRGFGYVASAPLVRSSYLAEEAISMVND